MKRGFSQNKLSKNKIILKKITHNSKSNIINNNINKENNEIQNPLYNIDLFTGVKEEFEKEKTNKNNNIYLNFYNKHTKNQVLQKENKISKKFFDNNIELIKEKQEKYKLKKEEEEKIRKQKEKEDTNEYRKEQMAKLYKIENVYKREIMKRKNKKIFPKSTEKISIIAKNKNDIGKSENTLENKKINNENDGKIIKMTKNEYDKKLDYIIKQTRTYVNELEKLPIANKTTRIYLRESQLNKYINELQNDLNKYKNKIGIIVEDE